MRTENVDNEDALLVPCSAAFAWYKGNPLSASGGMAGVETQGNEHT